MYYNGWLKKKKIKKLNLKKEKSMNATKNVYITQ